MRDKVLGDRARVYALFAIVVLASSFGNLSETAANAMLPDIMDELGIGVNLGQWLATGYMLVLGVTVPVATYLSKRFSPRRHIIIAMTFFFAGALADAVAPNFTVLFLGRVSQAISTGLLLPLVQTIAMVDFPRGRQATAMGVAGIALGFAPNIGPTIGGAMAFTLGWRSFFLLLLVAAVLLVVATIFLVRDGRGDRSIRFDTLSFALSALGFGGLLLGFSEASSFVPTSPFVWVPVAVGALFLFLFVWRQKRMDDPLIDMDIFRSRRYTMGFVALNLLHASFMGITLIVPLYVEGLGIGTSLDAGIVLLPGTLAALLLNPLAGFLTDKFGVRCVTLVSGLLLVVGSVLMATVDQDTALMTMMSYQALRAFGVSGLISPLSSWSMTELPSSIIPDGSSFSIAGRQACASLGTSAMVMSIVLAQGMSFGVVDPAFPYQLAFGLSAIFAIATFVVILAKVR